MCNNKCHIIYKGIELRSAKDNGQITPEDDENDEEIYEELCEKRALYHHLKRELESKEIEMQQEDYQLYLDYVNYCENLLNSQNNEVKEEMEEKQSVKGKPKKKSLFNISTK